MSKKSLERAKAEAKAFSKDHLGAIIKVMDKRGRKAIYTGSPWVYRERILCGYRTVASYVGGEEV